MAYFFKDIIQKSFKIDILCVVHDLWDSRIYALIYTHIHTHGKGKHCTQISGLCSFVCRLAEEDCGREPEKVEGVGVATLVERQLDQVRTVPLTITQYEEYVLARQQPMTAPTGVHFAIGFGE